MPDPTPRFETDRNIADREFMHYLDLDGKPVCVITTYDEGQLSYPQALARAKELAAKGNTDA